MCRKNQLWGLAVLTFGLGLLVACWMESEFTQICCGCGVLVAGVLILQKK